LKPPALGEAEEAAELARIHGGEAKGKPNASHLAATTYSDGIVKTDMT